MSEFKLKKFYPDEIIFKEGSKGESAYVLKTGRIEISIESAGKKTVLSVIEPTAVFGEMAVLSPDQGRSATAKAIEYTEVMEIDRETFDEYMRKSPVIISHLLKALVERLYKANARVQSSPVLFLGVSEVVHLLYLQGKSEFFYDSTVRSLSNAFNTEAVRIREKLSTLERLGMIEFLRNDMGQVLVRVIMKDSFMNHAHKAFQESGGEL